MKVCDSACRALALIGPRIFDTGTTFAGSDPLRGSIGSDVRVVCVFSASVRAVQRGEPPLRHALAVRDRRGRRLYRVHDPRVCRDDQERLNSPELPTFGSVDLAVPSSS